MVNPGEAGTVVFTRILTLLGSLHVGVNMSQAGSGVGLIGRKA